MYYMSINIGAKVRVNGYIYLGKLHVYSHEIIKYSKFSVSLPSIVLQDQIPSTAGSKFIQHCEMFLFCKLRYMNM